MNPVRNLTKKTRTKRRTTLQFKSRYPLAVEMAYERFLSQEVNRMQRRILSAFKQATSPVNSIRQDSLVEDVIRILRQEDLQDEGFGTRVTKKVGDFLKRLNMFSKQNFERNLTLAGVNPIQQEPWLISKLMLATKRNVNLIKSIPVELKPKIEKIITDGVQAGKSNETLMKEIMSLTEQTKRHAKLIARDQVAKFNSELEIERAKHNGIQRYRWRMMGDSRTRPDHRRLDGLEFAINDPPVTVTTGKRAGERNHPGQDIQCRCLADFIWEDILNPTPIQRASETDQRRWAEFNMQGVSADDVDLKEVEFEIAKTLHNGLMTYLGKYAYMPNRLKSIRYNSSLTKKKRTNMRTNGSDLEIGLSSRQHFTDKDWESTIRSSDRTSYATVKGHFQKELAPEVTMHHEIGHIWHIHLSKAWRQGDAHAGKILDEWNQMIDQYSRQWLSKNISKQASIIHDKYLDRKLQYSETLAESFALYSGGKSSILPTELKEFFDKHFRKAQ